MANKMLIDASHPEETRVVVLRGNRVEEFDFESASKKQLRGNIYLAKVMRVEPSLQAAFVDYGGNRHGFLAFSEIHPDYYQIPVADRQALIEEEARVQREEEEDQSRLQRRSRRFRRGERNGHRAEKRSGRDQTLSEPYVAASGPDEAAASLSETGEAEAAALEETAASHEAAIEAEALAPQESLNGEAAAGAGATAGPSMAGGSAQMEEGETRKAETEGITAAARTAAERGDSGDTGEEDEDESGEIEQLGGDAMEEMPFRPHRYRRQYKIQEVIKRRQVLLVQVVKEERGNKGAALTTYLSLAGRYSVLMPNTARGGGISRKITDATDRQRLKSIAQELDVPEGMGVIVRTAGAARTKAEVKRDFEYLLRMWETVRETTLKSTAPTLVYEEGSLIKRAIRDLYNKDIDEVVVAGEEGYREAKEFMRLLMPSHAKMVQPYRDPQPMFAKCGAEAQLDAMFSNQVTLKSGGYIVINQTEALVAIDVNSGRSTREHNIEDTALRTNLEAADEIARQLRLRDLAGLIVIDFIDMEENRNNRTVERRLKDALKNDRARIQVGRMSHFGLLEMSRQRMRTGVIEGSTVACPHCAGAGMVRSTSSIALHVLRALEDALMRNSSFDIIVKTRTAVALYILNQKRTHLRDLEKRFGVSVTIAADDSLTGTNYYALERGESAAGGKEAPALQPQQAPDAGLAENFFDEVSASERAPAASDGLEERELAALRESEGETEGRQRRRRRRRRGRGGDREAPIIAPNAPQPPDDALGAMANIGELQPGFGFTSESEPQESIFRGEEQLGADYEDASVLPGPERRRPQKIPELADAKLSGEELARESVPGGEPQPIAQEEIAAPESQARRAPRLRRARRMARVPGGRRNTEAAGIPGSGLTAEAGGLDTSLNEPEITAPPAREAEPATAFRSAHEERQEAPQNLAGDSTIAIAEAASNLSNEASQPAASDEEAPRPKRSGWWQRARVSWRS